MFAWWPRVRSFLNYQFAASSDRSNFCIDGNCFCGQIDISTLGVIVTFRRLIFSILKRLIRRKGFKCEIGSFPRWLQSLLYFNLTWVKPRLEYRVGIALHPRAAIKMTLNWWELRVDQLFQYLKDGFPTLMVASSFVLGTSILTLRRFSRFP